MGTTPPGMRSQPLTTFEVPGELRVRVRCRVVEHATGSPPHGGDQGGWSPKFDEPAQPGQSMGPHYAMLILPDYFSPEHPLGNLERLKTIGLGIVGAMQTDHVSLTAFTGPDSTSGPGLGGSGAFMLSSLAR